MKHHAVPDLLDADEEATASFASPIFDYANADATAAQALYADVAQTYHVASTGAALSGAGVTVGILSNSFNLKGGEAADVADGDLPSGIVVLKEGLAGDDDEGRAMAEGIHRIAPGAQIDFYSADGGQASFGAGILALFNAGARVIVDDVTYLDESFFQPGGPIDQAIDYVVSHGATYLTSAGNGGSEFYEANFTPIAATLNGADVQAENFGGGNALQSLTVQGGKTIQLTLEWDQPYRSISGGAGATSSIALELFLNGALVAVSNNESGVVGSSLGSDPVQLLTYTAPAGGASSLQLAIVENGGAAPGLFKYVAFTTSGSDLAINDPNAGVGSGAVVGHHEDPNAITVAAANEAATPRMDGAPATLDGFSADGPGAYLFAANGQRLATPQTLSAIAFTSVDGESTSVGGLSPFDGTSSAAANAAGVAALLLQATPAASPATIRADLTSTATATMSSAVRAGAGLIRADLAALATGNVVACFAAGAGIATPSGDVAVERLAIGGLVRTAAGADRPIRWIGRRAYAGPFLRRNPDLWPVRIRAGALADGVPRADLVVSPKHAMLIDGALVPAGLLVNGATIVREQVESVDYYHVELDSHDILLAEGAPAESFADLDGRAMFHNAASYDALYPHELRSPRLCAPRVEHGGALRDRCAKLLARSRRAA